MCVINTCLTSHVLHQVALCRKLVVWGRSTIESVSIAVNIWRMYWLLHKAPRLYSMLGSYMNFPLCCSINVVVQTISFWWEYKHVYIHIGNISTSKTALVITSMIGLDAIYMESQVVIYQNKLQQSTEIPTVISWWFWSDKFCGSNH